MVSLKQWVAYKSPELIGGMLNYTFSNSKSYITPQKKGFRQVRKTKPVSERYVIVFDYLLDKSDLLKLSENLKNISTKPKNIDKDVQEALSSLL